ncbi:hypothetical protein H7H73_22250 [Mycobacterium rufum]|uniref:PE family protein n=1 Tax=Mycolicibacterium rufum TaxID=318424 RepID=A0A9X2Y2I9_9MYCO|nr:hypothetical protein [Mycolicibacterium rufum]
MVTAFEFEDAIINTYHAIEPWVRYGFELATYAVGWVPWVGWLAPQIMIFYNFGERIVESLVVNSANWLWGPLPFGEGLANVARDSWDALVQLGRDEWNFWLPPLPPLPLTAEQTTDPAQDGITGTVDEPAAPSAVRPHPVRDALLALAHSLPVRPGAPHNTVRPRLLERIVHQPAAPDTDATPDGEVEGAAAPVDSRNDGIAPTDSDLPIPEPEKADDASQGDTRSADATGDSQQSGGAAEGAEKPSAAGDGAAHTLGGGAVATPSAAVRSSDTSAGLPALPPHRLRTADPARAQPSALRRGDRVGEHRRNARHPSDAVHQRVRAEVGDEVDVQ